MANSAFFASAGSVSSINQAFVRLGSRTVKEVVSAVATMAMFPDTTGLGGAIRDHCASTAALSQYIARELVPKQSEGIFLCGLMHDIGKMLLLESGESVYETTDILTALAPNSIHIAEREKLGYDHAILGGHTVTMWNLEGPISKVIAWHHQPARAAEDHELGMMIALLRAADIIDFKLRENAEDLEKWADDFAKSQESEFIGLSARWFKKNLPDLFQIRAESLAMFSK
jgi:putative nucleotidyltransferase with HDIG domain